MKRIFRLLWSLLPHITLILSLMLLTFFVIDLFNESMAFLNNSITKWLVAADALFTVLLSIVTICKHETKKESLFERHKEK